MSERLHGLLIKLIFVGKFVGVFGMIQPWSMALFKPGFLILFYSTLAYIVVSHITPRASELSTGESIIDEAVAERYPKE